MSARQCALGRVRLRGRTRACLLVLHGHPRVARLHESAALLRGSLRPFADEQASRLRLKRRQVASAYQQRSGAASQHAARRRRFTPSASGSLRRRLESARGRRHRPRLERPSERREAAARAGGGNARRGARWARGAAQRGGRAEYSERRGSGDGALPRLARRRRCRAAARRGWRRAHSALSREQPALQPARWRMTRALAAGVPQRGAV